MPGSLVPDEDQGYVFVVTVLPPAASLARTREVTAKATEALRKNPAVANVVTFSGFDLLSRRAEDQFRHLLRDAEGLVASARTRPRMRAISRRRSRAHRTRTSATAW